MVFKRNIDRFPEDFMFQLTKEEFKNLKSQFVTSSWDGARKCSSTTLSTGTLWGLTRHARKNLGRGIYARIWIYIDKKKKKTDTKLMNFLLNILICIITIITIGCSSSSGGDSLSNASGGDSLGNAPGISNFSYSPSSAVLNQGGGAITVDATFEFVDQDGDITTLISQKNNETETSIEINTNSHTNGSMEIIAAIITTEKGTQTYKIHVKDAKGNKSNILTGTFLVE
jgi:hypothetical protein